MPKNSGFTLVELLVSLLLLTIVFIGAMAFYFFSNENIQASFHRRLAAEIASSQMERIESTLASVPETEEEELSIETINIRHLSGRQETYIEDISGTGTLAQVTVEVIWDEPGKSQEQSLTLVTYIAL